MGKSFVYGFAAILLAATSAWAAEEKPNLDSDKAKLSYTLGHNIGKKLRQQQLELDPATLAAGLKDAFSKDEPLMTEAEMNKAMTQFQEQMRQKQMATQAQPVAGNSEFLAQNKEKEGVKTTESGLQYQVIEQGQGSKPDASDVVKVHYRGQLVDGTEFDSSYERGQPAEFPVNRVIKGWTEALQMMPVGSNYKLFIPSELAYGQRGAPPTIPPDSVLIFDVELLEIIENE